MKRIAVLSVLIMLLVPGWAAAQVVSTPPAPPAPPPGGPDLGKWWKNSEIAREIGLSEAQRNQLEEIFLEQRLKLIDLHAELEKQETRLQPLIEADHPDEARVSAQIDHVLAARGRLEKANAIMMLSIRRVLSVEQWKKLEAIQQERHRMHGRFAGPPLGAPGAGAPGFGAPGAVGQVPAPPAATPPPRPPRE